MCLELTSVTSEGLNKYKERIVGVSLGSLGDGDTSLIDIAREDKEGDKSIAEHIADFIGVPDPKVYVETEELEKAREKVKKWSLFGDNNDPIEKAKASKTGNTSSNDTPKNQSIINSPNTNKSNQKARNKAKTCFCSPPKASRSK